MNSFGYFVDLSKEYAEKRRKLEHKKRDYWNKQRSIHALKD